MKKTIILSLFLSVFMFITSNAATSYFNDIDGHWAEEYIETLRRMSSLNGENNNAEPEAEITRGEFSAIIARSFFEVDYSDYNTNFKDVEKNNIYAPYISIMYENKIINGINADYFYPDRLITREEIAIITSRIIKSNNTNHKIKFEDISIKDKYYKEISLCISKGIINGYPDNTFRPYQNTTRAEACAMIVRTLKAMANKSNDIEIFDFVRSFFESEISDKEFALNNSIGQAYGDISFTVDILNNIRQINRDVYDVKIDVDNSSDYLKNAKIEYTGIFDSGKYNISKNYKILKRNNRLMVYDINTDFKINDKINLTWEVTANAPSYSPVGLSHISPSFFEISKENTSGIKKDIGLRDVKLYDKTNTELINYSSQNNYDIWPMYKTDFDVSTANVFLNDDNARKEAITIIANQCMEYGIRGINVDFENMYKKDRDIFSAHIHELELIMHEIGVLVSADITKYEKTSEQWSLCYNRDRLSEYADYIILMAYDQHYAGSKTPGPVGGLGWVEDAVKLTTEEVPSEKLILGMPYYTRYWETVNGKVVSTKALSMESAIKMIKENNPRMIYVKKDGQHKAVWNKGNRECSFWFETAETIGKRVDIALKYNLAGVASWRRGFETNDVWNEIDKKINKT